MKEMNFEEIKNIIVEKFGSEGLIENIALAQPQLTVPASRLHDICLELFHNDKTFFDYLSCVTALDTGVQVGNIEIFYHLYSIPFNHHFILKVILDRGDENNLPHVKSITDIWRSADWHEREAYDMYGIIFDGHPDLRRILLPADWEGFPLRKDYKQQEYYRGIEVKY
jgi:NADH-quinone oxidoreductase subunit C